LIGAATFYLYPDKGRQQMTGEHSLEESPYWGKIVVDILKKLLEFNQLFYGSKKSF